MTLLIDSSSKKIGFGFADENGIQFREELEPGNNADTLTYFIKKTFDKNNVDLRKIGYVSLSNGPGSFTGLRIGSAIAKGICFATGCKLIEIPTLDIIAYKVYPVSNQNSITSLIFSNTRSLEFYYCSYETKSGKLIRISDYKTGLLEDIIKENPNAVTNEELSADFDPELRKPVTDVSKLSDIDSQYNLTMKYIQEELFKDYRISEPFYMKDFEALKN